ncbi:hypothetical protein KE423_003918 [Salmonella enterica]|nr:hypothetical protein [Salmonella enterica]
MKPHIFRHVIGSPIGLSIDGENARFLLVNDDGEFRAFWLYGIERHRDAVEARLRGDTHYASATPCPDCGGVDFYAHPLTWNTKELFGVGKFARGECYHCKKHPEARSPERREKAATVRGAFDTLADLRERVEALDALTLAIEVLTLREAVHYGWQYHGKRSTWATRAKAAIEAAAFGES